VTPDLIGLDATRATSVARQHGFTPIFDGAALDAAVPPGTVIVQSLPAGTRDSGPGPQVAFTLAVSRAPACTASQLALDYRGGGFGAGNDFGGIVFRDTSAAPCQLAGTVRLTGLDATGQPDTGTITAAMAGPGVLSPKAPLVPAYGAPAPGQLVYLWSLGAEYRDGSTASGLCARPVTPAAWRVTLAGPGTFVVRDVAPGRNGGVSPTGGLITCAGNVRTAGGPAYWTS
jgi:hypothetical protein